MKRIFYIACLVALVTGMSSCAKEELEAPAESAHPQAIKTDNQHDAFLDRDNSDTKLAPLPSSINDDGDDEDEGINKGKKKTSTE